MKSKFKNSAGFTLVELLVVMAIIVIISGVSLANWRGGEKQYALLRATNKLSQDLRRAEEMAMSAREFQGQIPKGGYGVYFKDQEKDHYVLFADLNGNHSYNSGSDGLIEDVKIEKDIQISQLSASPLTITFTPPDPTVTIKPDDLTATITLAIETDPTKTRTITVNKSGLVFIGVSLVCTPGTTCNGDCSICSGDGTSCGPKTAGENNLPSCQRCDGSSLTSVDITTYNDSEGSNTCVGTCAGYCSSGSCVTTDSGAGTCNTGTNVYVGSGGNGHCTSGSCVADCDNSVTFTYKGSSVTYGTFSSQGKCWLDRNLGASRVATAYNDSAAYGDLFQWGRLNDGHQTRTSGTTTTLSRSDNPGHSNFIYCPVSYTDWRLPQNNNLWQGVLGINNPCPSGWRLPTNTEWDTERASWSQQNYNGAYASSLKLTAAGDRVYNDASLANVGSRGLYWASTVGTGAYARFLSFDSSGAVMNGTYRAFGFSVRCIQD